MCSEAKLYLLIKIYEGAVRELERLNGQQDRVPVATVDVCNEAVQAFHGVE